MSFKNAVIVSIDTDAREYHRRKQAAGRGTPAFPMSPSALKEFSRCPSAWIRGYAAPDSDAKSYGNLLDVSLLTPQFQDQYYAIKPATYVNEKGEEKKWIGSAKVCKAWQEEQEAEGREPVSKDDVTECGLAIKRLRDDETIARFLDASDKQVLVRGEWHDEKTGLVIPSECLIDAAPRRDTEFLNCLGDLKSARSAAIRPFSKWALSNGYDVQAAFDLDLYNAATGEKRVTWCFILSESFPPYEIGRRMLEGDEIAMGQCTYKRLMENYCACLKAGKWPGFDDNKNAVQGKWTQIIADKWQLDAAMMGEHFDFTEPEAEDDAPPGIDIYAAMEAARNPAPDGQPKDLIP